MHCRKQLGQLRGAHAQIAARGARLVAVSVDDVATNRALADRLEIGDTFPLLADPDLTTIRAWGVEDVGHDLAVPATFVVGPDGRVRWVYVGDSKRDRPLPDVVLAVLDGG